uniref:Uncharacterized protein n=1 Tax=Lepeophtheirus salmonis TaxID=72036 RepID=A0A0K2UEB1_LEPSM
MLCPNRFPGLSKTLKLVDFKDLLV